MKKLFLFLFLFLSVSLHGVAQLVTSQDTLKYNITLIQSHMISYADQSRTGFGLFLTGVAATGITVLAYSNASNRQDEGAILIGCNVVTLAGLIVNMTASKHLRRAAEVPIFARPKGYNWGR